YTARSEEARRLLPQIWLCFGYLIFLTGSIRCSTLRIVRICHSPSFAVRRIGYNNTAFCCLTNVASTTRKFVRPCVKKGINEPQAEALNAQPQRRKPSWSSVANLLVARVPKRQAMASAMQEAMRCGLLWKLIKQPLAAQHHSRQRVLLTVR